jgi:hypothetical protein
MAYMTSERVHKAWYGILAFSLVAVFLGLSHITAHAAFGISPPFLNADHLVKGSHYVQTVYLVQDDPSEDLAIEGELDVNDRVKSWFTINSGNPILIPKGTKQFPVQIDVQVPQDADLGVYSGSLSFRSKPAQAGQVTIALGVEVAINLTVGDGIYRQYNVPLIKFLDIEEGWSPRVYVKFNNEGNVPESFDGATYELFDQFGAVRLAYIQKSKGFEETPPFTVKDYTIEFPIDLHLGLGQYWGSVAFFKEGKVIATQRTVFTVLKRGSLSGPVAQIISWIKANKVAAGGAALVLLFIIVGVFRLRRRRRARG